MSTIDNRVVELDLKNASYERHAKQSIETTERLDKVLQFNEGRRGFEKVEEVAKKTNFESLLKAADVVSNRLSTLGIIGVTALTNITNKAVDAGEKLIKSLTIDPITTGWSKYEEINNSTRTLLNTSGKTAQEVDEAIEHLTWFSDETSYSLTNMTNALSSMASNGGDITKLTTMLEGVANSISFAGQSAGTLEGVLYNLNQSYAGGFLNYMDFMSLNRTYHVFSKELKQAYIDAGKMNGTLDAMGRTAAGTLVTIENFGTTLSDRWATSEVMEAAYNSFAEMTEKAYEMIGTLDETGKEIETASQAYAILEKEYDTIAMKAAKSAQEAKTFGEAIAATKDAVSTGWAQTFKLIIGNVDQASKLWTDVSNKLWDVFAAPISDQNDILKEAFSDTWNSASFEIRDATGEAIRLEEVLASVSGTKLLDSNSPVEHITNVQKALQRLGYISDNAVTGIMDPETLSAINKFQKDMGMGFTSLAGPKTLGLLQQKLTEICNTAEETVSMSLADAFGELPSDTESFVKQLSRADRLIKSVAGGVDSMSDRMIEASGYTREQLKLVEAMSKSAKEANMSFAEFASDIVSKNARDSLIGGLANLFDGLLSRMEVVKDTWAEVFPAATAQDIRRWAQNFERLTEKFIMTDEAGERLTFFFEKFFGLLKEMSNVGSSTFGVLQSVFDLLLRFGDWALQQEPVQEALQALAEALGLGYDGTITNLRSMTEWLDKLSKKIRDIDPTQFAKVAKVLGNIYRLLKPVGQWIIQAGAAAINMFSELLVYLEPIGSYIWNELITPIGEFIAELARSDDPIQTLKDGFSRLKDKISDVLQAGKDFAKNLSFTKIIEDIREFLASLDDSDSKFKPLSDWLNTIGQKGDELKDKLDFGTILAGLTAAGAFIGLAKLTDALTDLGDMAKTVKTTFSNINNILTAKFGSSVAANLKAIAGAVVMLAGAIWIVAQIPEDDFTRSFWSIVGLIGVLTVVAGALTYVSSKIDTKTMTALSMLRKTLLTISSAILIVSIAGYLAAQALTGVDTIGEMFGKVGAVLLLIVGLTASLIAATWVLSRFSAQISVGALTLLVVAGIITLVVAAVAKMLKLSEKITLNDMTPLIEIVGTMAIIMALLARSGKNASKGISAIGKLLIAVALLLGAMKLAVALVTEIQNVKIPNPGATALDLLGVFLVIALVAVALAGLNKIISPSVDSLLKIAGSIALAVAAMYILQLMLTKLAATINPETANDAVGALVVFAVIVAGLALALAGAARITKRNKDKEAMNGIVSIAASILVATLSIVVLVGALLLLNTYLEKAEPATDNLWMAVGLIAALALILGVLAIAIGFAAKLGNGTGIALCIAAVLGIIVMIGIVIVLAKVIETNGDIIDAAITRLWAIMLAFAVLVVAIGAAAKLAGSKGMQVVSLVMIALVIVALGYTLASLADLPMGAIWSAVGALVVILAALVGSVFLIEEFVEGWYAIGKLVASLGIMSLFMLAIASAMWIVSFIPADRVWQVFGVLAATLGVIAVFVIGLSALFGYMPQIAIGAGILAGVLLSIAAVIAVFAAAMFVLDMVNLPVIGAGLVSLGDAAIPLLLLGAGLIVAGAGALVFIAGFALFLPVALGVAIALTVLNAAFIGIMNTISAFANAFQNANGSIIGALANLRGELTESAKATREATGDLFAGAFEGIGEGASALIGDAMSDIPEASTAAIESGTPEVKAAATEMVDETADAVEEEAEKKAPAIKDALTKFLSGGGNAITGLTDLDFSSAGQNALSSMFNFNPDDLSGMLGDKLGSVFSGGIGGMDTSALTGQIESVIGGSMTDIDLSQYTDATGTEMVTGLSNVVSSDESKQQIRESATELGEEFNTGASSVDTSSTGVYYVEGLVKGMESRAEWMIQRCMGIGASAADAIAKGGGVASPSKLTMQTGKYLDEGLIVGINALAIKAVQTAYSIGNRVADAVADGADDSPKPVLDMTDVYNSIDEFDDTWRPVIKPVLDMSDVNPGALNVRAVASGFAAEANAATQNSATVAAGGNVTNFVQNNYSPKALDRIEIYRQTQNLVYSKK